MRDDVPRDDVQVLPALKKVLTATKLIVSKKTRRREPFSFSAAESKLPTDGDATLPMLAFASKAKKKGMPENLLDTEANVL